MFWVVNYALRIHDVSSNDRIEYLWTISDVTYQVYHRMNVFARRAGFFKMSNTVYRFTTPASASFCCFCLLVTILVSKPNPSVVLTGFFASSDLSIFSCELYSVSSPTVSANISSTDSGFTLFHLATFLKIVLASSTRPLDMSHLADSSRILQHKASLSNKVHTRKVKHSYTWAVLKPVLKP